MRGFGQQNELTAEEARWSRREEADAIRHRMRELTGSLRGKRVKIWARVRLGEERGVDAAREYGYRSGAGVTLVVRRLEASAQQDRKLKRVLEQVRTNAFRKV